jgi:tetratricopeptide (TPR) repeat protein
MQNGRSEQVLSELDAVWSNQLASDSPWYLRTAALQLLGRMSDAEQVLRDAIARLPRSAAMLYLLGVHTSYRGQVDAARLANEHALSLHPTEALLWLQRAALEQGAGMDGNAAAALEHVQTLEPSFPATSWLATLMRLGDARDRTTSPTPVLQRALERLTPAGVPVISDQPAPDSVPTASPGVLETAVRYGLTLLESPTQSARTATQVTASGESVQGYGEMMARAAAQQTVSPGAFPSWEALVLTTGLMVIAFVPPLRIPALLVTGGVTMLLVSRAMR